MPPALSNNDHSLDVQVAAAAIDLRERKQKVTVQAVRQALGGGSFREIGPALQRWRQSIDQSHLAVQDLPKEIQDAGLASAAAIWSAAQRLAASQIAEVTNRAQNELEAQRIELAEALEEIDRLDRSLQQCKEDLEHSKSTERASSTRSAHLEGQVEQMNSEAGRQSVLIRELRQELHEANVRVEGASMQIGELRSQVGALRVKLKSPPGRNDGSPATG